MIAVGDRITEERDGVVVAIHVLATVSRRGGVYTCTTARSTPVSRCYELRLRDAGADVTSADRTWSTYRRTVDGDEAALAATHDRWRLAALVRSERADPDSLRAWAIEQVRAVLAAWPTSAAPQPAKPKEAP